MMTSTSAAAAATVSTAALTAAARPRRGATLMTAHPCAVSSSFRQRVTVGNRTSPASSTSRRDGGLVCHAKAANYTTTSVGSKGRKRRVIKPFTGDPSPAVIKDDDDGDGIGDEETDMGADCPSDGACSIESASPDEEHDREKQRGYQSDAASTEEAHERQREQLAAMRAAAAPAVKRKRRVLKKLSKVPSATPEMSAMVFVEEGNCPSDGCSLEAATPPAVDGAAGDASIKRRGYQSQKHSSQDARERLAIQMEILKKQRVKDAARAEAARAEEEAAATKAAAATTPEEKAKAKAQKEAFYFSAAGLTAAAAGAAYALLGVDVPSASAAVTTAAGIDPFFNFNPVCPASDGVFRVGQRAALSLAGDQNIENYRPLINDVLIRVRTELCILESFGRETALPFIREKGLGWVLPLHETSETYLAGVVFMVGTNFILLGSTKVVAILAIYHDLSLGLLARGAGGLLGMASPEADSEKRDKEFNELMDRQMAEVKELMMDQRMSRTEREAKTAEINRRYSNQMEETKESMDQRSAADETSTVAKVRRVAGAASVPLRLYGKASGMVRNGLELFDTFCSRYFVAFTVTYIIVKTTHYVLFPDLFD